MAQLIDIEQEMLYEPPNTETIHYNVSIPEEEELSGKEVWTIEEILESAEVITDALTYEHPDTLYANQNINAIRLTPYAHEKSDGTISGSIRLDLALDDTFMMEQRGELEKLGFKFVELTSDYVIEEFNNEGDIFISMGRADKEEVLG